jgi:hypothetical protein
MKKFNNKTFLSLLPHLAAGFLATQCDPLLTTLSFIYLALCQIAKLNHYADTLSKIGTWIHIITAFILALKGTAIYAELHIGLVVTLPLSILLLLLSLIKKHLFTLHDAMYITCIVVFFFLYRESPPFHLPFILMFYDVLFIGGHPSSRPDYLGAVLIFVMHIFTQEELFTFALPISYLAAKSVVRIFVSIRECLKDEKCRSSNE